MNSDKKDLYRDLILDHNRSPRNFGTLLDFTHSKEGHNPLCGDKVHLFLKIENDIVQSVCFTGEGCAISTASSSLLTEVIQGKSVKEIQKLSQQFCEAMESTQAKTKNTPSLFSPEMGDLRVFEGIAAYPARTKCVTLAWITLQKTFNNPNQAVSNE